MEKLVCKKANKSVLDFITQEITDISYNTLQKLLRKKDVKVNGTRIKQDQSVDINDVVEVYVNIKNNQIEVVYQDDDIVVVNKPVNIEVVSLDCECLHNKLEKQLNIKLYAVHRIDRNTTGLVIFAKTEKIKDILETAFKNHTIKKYYLCVVCGEPAKPSAKLVAYHKKDANKSMCYILDNKAEGYSKIITIYKTIKTNSLLSLLQVEIQTGKTHQIRAHLAHIGHAILGDQKYGNKQLNKQYKTNKQLLTAYKLDFSNIKEYAFNVKTIELSDAIKKYKDLV